MKKIYLYAGAAILIILAAIFILPCKKNKIEIIPINPAFGQYIAAFSSGIVSSESKIRIKLANDFAGCSGANTPIENSLFDFSPDIKGSASWVDCRTIEFRPEKNIPSGKSFVAKFFLSRLMEVPAEFGTFEFSFQTMVQSFEINFENVKTYDKKVLQWQRLIGSLVTADISEAEKIEQILKASQQNNFLKIKWEHFPDRKTHRFQVDSIERKETKETVLVQWDGSPLDIDLSGKKEIEIPSLKDFKLVNTEIVQSPEQYILLQFSDPLLDNQNLDGLIHLGQQGNLRFAVEDNEIKVYLSTRQSGSVELQLDGGIKNILGYRLENNITQTLVFEELKPGLRLLGKGVILPGSDGLIFPFEAVNLKAVDVSVLKIYENNIAQFLQVNALDGVRELSRVGKKILKKTISLESQGVTDFGKWNRFTLDLSDLIKSEPGAIYKVQLGFKKKYSTYYCADNSGKKDDMELQEVEEEAEDDYEKEASYWDYYDGYYEDYYYPENYQWNQRDNPCSESYYLSSRWVSRNVLASDLGLIAKRGNSGSMNFVVTDLKTTKPVSNAILELYDFQQQLISTVKSDNNGFAAIDLKQKPFLLVAKKETQRGYLKLDDGSSLQLSKFDVTGEVVQKGIKGFIYGERGVWRPGDTLFLTFILEDEQKLIPDNHPASMELFNPQGQLVSKIIRANVLDGFYSFTTVTEANAPTGNWNAKIKVGGAEFNKTIKIETIMPNRLKIYIDFGKEKLTAENAGLAGKLEVKWLHGAIAKNLKAKIEVQLNSVASTFKNYTGFIFDDPARKFLSEPQIIFDGRLDEKGLATIHPDIEVKNAAPGILKANFSTRVFEEGGAYSLDRFSIPYYPYKNYLGIKMPKGDKARSMLLTDTNHIVNIVSLDSEGRPVSLNDVEVSVYKVNWKWWFSKEAEDFTDYVGSSYHLPLKKETINIVNGKAEWKFRINYPDWGRYLVRVCDGSNGHCTGQIVYVDWPGWAGRAQKDPSSATMLTFSADKEKYNLGENIQLTFPSSEGGRALLTFETGSRVINSFWIETQKGQTMFSVPTTKEMAPNVYAYITLVQPHNQAKNDLPIRMYGVIPIQVEDPNTHLKPVITMPEKLRPEEKVAVTVKEENGKPMTYTIAMVDEGLLDLTRFKTPDPWASFYAREALGVKTWDLFDYVMGSFGGELEKLLALGGDDEIRGKDGKKAHRFKPMVKFLGPFHLKKGGKNNHEILMPQYVGSVRTMVIAGYERAYGFSEKTTPVRKPLMALATLPRVLGPGEEVKLPVSIFAMEKNVKNVKVEVIANDLLMVQGSKEKNISFSEPGDEIVDFDLKVKPVLGIGKVKVIASSGNEKAEYDIEIEIRNPNPRVTNVSEAVIEPGKSWDNSYLPPGMSGTNKGMIEVSAIPPINLGKRLQYLIGYPHGCIEQTTSGAFPQLFLADIMELSPEMKSKIEDNIKAGINRIRTFQTMSGGLGYWPNAEADEWGTNYAGHFMIEAELKGYAVPYGFMDQWKNFQKQKALTWQGGNDYASELIQAYRLYTLALAKTPELGAMNRLREQKNLSLTAQWRLAAAYYLAGQAEVANQVIKNLGTEVKKYRELSYTYGSTTRDEAMILEALSLMGERTKATPLMMKVAAALSNEQWLSTQETAYSLIAISKYTGKSKTSGGLNFTYKINNESPVKASTQLPVSQIDMKMKGANSGKTTITNNGSGVIYARVILDGIPETGDQSSAENSLSVTINYTTIAGNEIDPGKIEQGTDFKAEIKITNPGMRGVYKELALTQIFPSGWEIRNMRMEQVEIQKSSPAKYQDIRDDRVYTYFDLKPNETKIFTVLLNASYLGRYYLPTVSAEAMYDASINARKPGKWIEVVTQIQ